MSDHLLIIPRYGGDELRIGLDEYNGHQFLSLRTYFDAGGGNMKPTRKGVSVPLSALDELRQVIDRVQTRPRSATVTSLAAHMARRDRDAEFDVIDTDPPTAS